MRRIFIGLLLLSSVTALAQDDLDKFLSISAEDGNKLVEGYMDPMMKSISLGMNQGWYNTAKTHKVAGFDLTFTAAAMIIPSSDFFYNIENLNLDTLQLETSSPDYPNAPTIFGPDRAPIYSIEGSTEPPFEGPPGLDLKSTFGNNWMPVPMVTLGFGLPKDIDVKFRFLPNQDIGDDGKVKFFGIGVMHNVKQYIPGLKLLPFDLSAFVGYTRLEADYAYNDNTDVYGENRKGVFTISATTIEGVISKKISVITFYGGLGYNIAKSNVAVDGWWDFDDDKNQDSQEVNPVDLDYSASGFKMTGGFRLKLAVFTLHADYTLQKYQAFTVGFGINVR